jgi:hypothetical protein
MRFRNTKTGAIVDVPSMLRGNWELIDGGKPEKVVPVPVPDASEDVYAIATKTVRKSRTRKSKK